MGALRTTAFLVQQKFISNAFGVRVDDLMMPSTVQASIFKNDQSGVARPLIVSCSCVMSRRQPFPTKQQVGQIYTCESGKSDRYTGQLRHRWFLFTFVKAVATYELLNSVTCGNEKRRHRNEGLESHENNVARDSGSFWGPYLDSDCGVKPRGQ